jgi:SAM-dependent methyltransferase
MTADPDPHVQVHDTRAYYDAHAAEYAELTLPQSMSRWLNLFTARLPAGTELIDLGCGAGRDLRSLRNSGFPTVGLDLSERLVAIAKTYAEAPVVVGDMRRLPFADDTFGGAWASASLLHLPRSDIGYALAEIRRVLAKNGVLFVSLKYGRGIARDAGGRWFTLVDPDELQRVLMVADFEVLMMQVDPRPAAELDVGDSQWISCLAARR